MMKKIEPEYPQNLARFYDVVYDVLRSNDEQFYHHVLKETLGCILELGVGTGRIFTKALIAGIEIFGIDNSNAMLEILRRKLPAVEYFRLFMGDVRTYSFNQKFDMVIAPFRFFSHFITTEDQLSLLSNIYKSIQPGGSFVFDVIAPRPIMFASTTGGKKLDFHGEWMPGKYLKRYSEVETCFLSQIQSVSIQYEWEGEDGSIQFFDWYLKSRFFYLFELEHILARSGFYIEKIFGDYRYSPVTLDTSDYVLFCKKM